MVNTSSMMGYLLGSLLASLVCATPLVLERRAPAIASSSNTLPLQRQVRYRPNAPSRSTLKNPKALGLAPVNNKPYVQAEGDSVDFSPLSAAADEPGAEGIGAAINANHQVEYITPITTANGGSYNLIIDTGSSDTWVVKNGFQCLNSRRQRAPFEQCDFGPVWKGEFPQGLIPSMHFNITYGSTNGPFLNGEMGYTDLTVANIKVAKQQIALATHGMWFGDGISSGILGLGLPALTEAHNGSRGADGNLQVTTYDPVATTISKMTKQPLFSLALARNQSESFIAFGGVPPQVKTNGVWATTPIEKLRTRDGRVDYFYYTIEPTGFTWNNTKQTRQAGPTSGFIVDSGTTLNLFPYELATSINNMFTPAAAYDANEGAYFVPCNATPPSLGINLGGTVIWTDPASMILPEIKNRRGQCATGIAATDAFPYILGDTFMQNLVTVFDLSSKMEIRYAQRVF